MSTKAKAKQPKTYQPNPAVISAMKAELAKVKKGDVSKCEAIRTVAKRLHSIPWGVITQTLSREFRLNLGTVKRQVQEGRSQ